MVAIASIEPDPAGNPENSANILAVDPAGHVQHAANNTVQIDNELLRIGRSMVSEGCSHDWCQILLNECSTKCSDQCGSGCRARCQYMASLFWEGVCCVIVCVPLWIIVLPLCIIYAAVMCFVDSSSCSCDPLENDLLRIDVSACERTCGLVRRCTPVMFCLVL